MKLFSKFTSSFPISTLLMAGVFCCCSNAAGGVILAPYIGTSGQTNFNILLMSDSEGDEFPVEVDIANCSSDVTDCQANDGVVFALASSVSHLWDIQVEQGLAPKDENFHGVTQQVPARPS